MHRTVYNFLTYLALPLVLLRLLWRSRKAPGYRRRWRERLGWYSHQTMLAPGPTLILHAVSVGEVHAAQPLIEQILAARPGLNVVVTTATPTGSARVEKLFGKRVYHVYLPYDLPGAVQRFLSKFSPTVLVLLETELWPNLLQACERVGCKVILANARLSPKSQRSYLRVAVLTQIMLQSMDTVAAQASADGDRFITLGLDPRKLQINGTLKFDVAVNQYQLEQAQVLKSTWAGRPVWIAASTREGEENKVLQAFASVLQQLPHALLVLVPRHPERFHEALTLAELAGFNAQQFSAAMPITLATQVLVGDTMGDMAFYYGLADLAFVGGSLINTGCQNIIEPAAMGLPILTGPSLFNFQAVSELLLTAGGMETVADAETLGARVAALLQHTTVAREMGKKALEVVAANQGATARLCKLILVRLTV
ncbi:MAG: lipid IV(A) 3-deoxy-D-manno-octulosonic acid transferase [Pseudohongiellaceae bacterium]